MNKLIIATIALLFSIKNSQTCQIDKNSLDYSKSKLIEIKPLYKVYKIDSINSWYLIYAKKIDSVYKIVSRKEIVMNCSKIQINKEYHFKLISWFPSNQKGLDISFKSIPHLAGYGFDDSTTITLEKDSINDLMYAENVRGLCFMGDQ
jgi:hypothetical protein